MSKRAQAYLALLGNTLLWGMALPIVKPALTAVSPYNFLHLRYLIAAPFLLPFLIFYLFHLKPKLKQLLLIVALEILAVPLPLSFLYQGLQRTTAIEASLLATTTPIFITLGGIIFLKEKQESREWFGLSLAFLGTLILVLEPLITGRNHFASFSFTGNLMVIIHNLLWTSYLLLAKKFYRSLPKLFISSVSALVAIPCFYLLSLIFHSPTSLSMLSIPSVALASIYMAIPGSIIAFTLYLFGQNLIEASEASLFSYLQGVVAIPASMILLHESVTWPMILAISIISGGVFLGEYRVRKRLRH